MSASIHRWCLSISLSLGAAANAAAPPASRPAPPSTVAAPTSATPASSPTSSVAAPTFAAPTPPEVIPLASIDKQIDTALAHFLNNRWGESAGLFFAIFRSLPETDLRRDTAQFYLGCSLVELGYVHAAAEHFFDIVGGRRAPDLVGRSLGKLDALVRSGQLDDTRLINEVLFGNSYGDLPPETAGFVEYYQSVGELRRGYTDWGTRRLEALSQLKAERGVGSGQSPLHYGWQARYALAVERLADGNEDGAEKLLRTIVENDDAPPLVRNQARLALARILFEHKSYEAAFTIYNQIDSPLPLQDVVLLEKAWDRVAADDEPRALGMVVGLGAPVYRRLFAPERSLIRAIALKRLCQFRAAHLSVLDYRRQYGAMLEKIRDRQSITDDKLVREAIAGHNDLLPAARLREKLQVEQQRLPQLSGNRPLREYLELLYRSRVAQSELSVARGLDGAADKVANELLRIDEQMTILDYEIGVGLFKGSGEKNRRETERKHVVPYSSDKVYYRFTGEYWSDELQDFSILAEYRCVQ